MRSESTFYSGFSGWLRRHGLEIDDKYGRGSLGNLSDVVARERQRVLDDQLVTVDEIQRVQRKTADAVELHRGFLDGSSARGSSEEMFRLFVEAMQIEFQAFAGENLRGGLLGKLVGELKDALPPVASELKINASLKRTSVQKQIKNIANELLLSTSHEAAVDKINLMKAQLARLGDAGIPALQRIGEAMRKEINDNPAWVQAGGPVIRPEDVARALEYKGVVAVEEFTLPSAVDKNEPFAKKPIAGLLQIARDRVASGFDRLEAVGQPLFFDPDRAPPTADAEIKEKLARRKAAGEPVMVTLKPSLNMGIHGPPTVAMAEQTYATAIEALERLDRAGFR